MYRSNITVSCNCCIIRWCLSQLWYKHIYKYKTYNTNAGNSVVSDTNGLFIFWLRPTGTWGERHNSYYANHPQRAAHLVVFKISVGRDPKNPTTSFNDQNFNSLPQWQKLNCLPTWSNLNFELTFFFQNPQILRTISSGHDVILTLAPFPVWGFIMTMVIVISFAFERRTVPNDYAPELLTRIVQSPTKLRYNIINEKW